MSQTPRDDRAAPRSEARRAFLKKAGKAALAAPPAVTLIMAATSKPAKATPPYWAPAHGWRENTGNTNWIGFPGSRGKN